ncbi:MAG: hypothetical protein WC100_18855 [Sterolibacterium sp.]
MTAYGNLIFQAKCQIDYIESAEEEGCRFESIHDDAVEIELSDGSYTTVYLEPIEQLIAALRRLPNRPPA